MNNDGPGGTAAETWEEPRSWPEGAERLARELGLSAAAGAMLILRGEGRDAASAERFLRAGRSAMRPPGDLPGVKEASRRIEQAVREGAPVLIHGDYDADGITGTALLYACIRGLGGRCLCHLPERADGYGVSAKAVRAKLMERGRRDGALLVTVDCGISNAEEIARARRDGIDTIVTDHHARPGGRLPEGLLVHPNLKGREWPQPETCGAGVAWRIAWHLAERHGKTAWPESFLKLAAIATVADMMPLTGENRALVRKGLHALNRAGHAPGLRALTEAATRFNNGTLTAETIAFQIAPRLNAAGRMESPESALNLLLARDERTADEGIRKIDDLNDARKTRQREITKEALDKLADDERAAEAPITVVWSRRWTGGLCGPVAGSLAQKRNRPALVARISGKTAQGSGRSVEGVDLLRLLRRHEDLFDKLGGHAKAAGFTLPAGRLPELRRRLSEDPELREREPAAGERMRCDLDLPLARLDERTARDLDRMEPFGRGNERPVFRANDVTAESAAGRGESGLMKAVLRGGEGRRHRATGWQGPEMAERLIAGDCEILYSPANTRTYAHDRGTGPDLVLHAVRRRTAD